MEKADLIRDTIAAIATPPGAGGVGIVRLSGTQAPEILSRLFSPGRRPEEFESHRLYPGVIRDPVSGSFVDEVLAVRMHAPRSYTGEEVAEIQSHGSPLILRRIVDLAISLGARAARPGEFTERAFLSGKIDLTQAEAVADLISARTERARRQALEVLRGSLSTQVAALANRLRRALAHSEVMIDFSEEDAMGPDAAAVSKELESIRGGLGALLESYRHGKIIREGAKAVLAGAPNAGKSSLFNALLEEERAIVHDEPGTTRDRLEEWLDVQGIPVRLVDTAGLREADGVEAAGVGLARKAIEEADVLLILADAAKPVPAESLELLEKEKSRAIPVASKMDLPGASAPPGWIPLSIRTGHGLAAIKDALAARLSNETGEAAEGGAILTRERHRNAVAEAARRVREATLRLSGEPAPELAAVELRGALSALAEIAGETANEDVLGLIFSEFCIGK